MKKLYKIALWGCDDATQFEMELEEAEYELIKAVCEKANKTSEYICMPTMQIREIKPENLL